MKKIFILVALIFAVCQFAKADQYLSVNSELAKKALALLANEKEAIIYCPTCTDKSKSSVINTTYDYSASCWGGEGIHIYGTGKNGESWCNSVDLAYLHIRRGDRAVAVAEILGLKSLVDSTQFFRSSFKWIERSDSYWKEKDRSKGPEKITLRFNSEYISYEIDTTYYYQDSTDITHILIPEVYDSGTVFVGEFPDMEFFENEYGGIEMYYELFDHMSYVQQMNLTQDEIGSLTGMFVSDLELDVGEKTLRYKSEYYRLSFSYKGLRAEVGRDGWDMFAYYVNEGGFPREIVLTNLEFIYRDCNKTTTYQIGNIRLRPFQKEQANLTSTESFNPDP